MSSKRERTRTAILDAAWKRLSTPGDPTRLEDIAADVGVTRQSVHLHFRTRGALLVALVQHVDESLGLVERIAEIRACADPVESLEKGLSLTATYQAEIHGVAMALATLAASDPDARAAIDDRMTLRREGLVTVLRAVQRSGRLSPDWPLAKVADVLWEAGAPSTYQHLVVERGWSVKDYERWLLYLARTFLRGTKG